MYPCPLSIGAVRVNFAFGISSPEDEDSFATSEDDEDEAAMVETKRRSCTNSMTLSERPYMMYIDSRYCTTVSEIGTIDACYPEERN